MTNLIKPINLLIDTDMGWDDVLSILYLIKNPNVNIVGITVTGCGETHLADGVEIAKSLLEMGNIDAPVAAGAAYPGNYNHQFPESFRKDMDSVCGLRNLLPTPKKATDPRAAWDLMNDCLAQIENQITILSIGGLTNIARLMELQPQPKLENIERIIIMGGALNVDGNVAALNNAKPEWDQGQVYSTNNYAEWNLFIDPAAAKKVLQSSIPITLVPLDACDYVILDRKYSTSITANDDVAQFAKKLIANKISGPGSEPIPVPVFDPMAAMIASSSLHHINMNSLRLDINTTDYAPDNMCGQITVSRDEKLPKVDVLMGVSATEFGQVYSDIMNLPLQPGDNIIHKNVGILLFDQVEVQDFAGAYEVFAAARNADGSAVFNVFTISQNLDPIHLNAGEPTKVGTQSCLTIQPDYAFTNHPQIDVLLIVGGQGIDEVVQKQDEDPTFVNWLKATAESATYVAGICSGVILLSKTGLLHDMEVSTHHTRFKQLQQMSDQAKLNLKVVDTRNGKNFVHNPASKFMTSGGVHCGIAVAVHLVGLILGTNKQESLASDVLEYTIPRGENATPPDFPAPQHMDPTKFILGFSHMNVIVADVQMMEEATAFYERVLGFQQAWSLWLPKETCEHFAHDAGFEESKVMVRFLKHPNAQLHLELMMYEYPKGDQEIHFHKTNDVGGVRHIAMEVTDAVAVYNWLKDQEGVTIIKPVREGYVPEKLLPDPQTFFYWLDPYGVQWEMEQGRPMARVINGIIG